MASKSNITPGQTPNMNPSIKLSATSDHKEFNGRNLNEDEANSWVNTMKTAFTRDQAPDGEKCLFLGGMLAGQAQNWYRRLRGSIRGS